ncbi:hypothetical protein LguiA_021596 [Lonicera macranthoides]
MNKSINEVDSDQEEGTEVSGRDGGVNMQKNSGYGGVNVQQNSADGGVNVLHNSGDGGVNVQQNSKSSNEEETNAADAKTGYEFNSDCTDSSDYDTPVEDEDGDITRVKFFPIFDPKKGKSKQEHVLGMRNDKYRQLVICAERCSWRIALGEVEASLVHHYAKLWDYGAKIRRSNFGSTVRFEVDRRCIQQPNYFKRMYVCFAAVKKAWLAGCKPVIGLDGCFLKGGWVHKLKEGTSTTCKKKDKASTATKGKEKVDALSGSNVSKGKEKVDASSNDKGKPIVKEKMPKAHGIAYGLFLVSLMV